MERGKWKRRREKSSKGKGSKVKRGEKRLEKYLKEIY